MKIAFVTAVAWSLVAADDPAQRELEKYQGTWVLVSEEFEGKPVPIEKRPEMSLTVRGRKGPVHVQRQGTIGVRRVRSDQEAQDVRPPAG